MQRVFRGALCMAFALLVSFPGLSESVSKERAKKAAEAFFLGEKALSETPHSWTNNDNQPAFFIFSRERGGFVIIASDDNINPILGYSDTGVFKSTTDMPENIRYWFDGFATEARNGISDTKARLAKERWKEIESGRNMRKAGAPKHLETALWDQSEPYNALCPTSGGKRCVTGCVATAMAIVLRYYRFPAHGTGSIPNYVTRSGVHYNGYALGYDYDWDHMPLRFDANTYTQQEVSAVATLMRDCGYMVEMDYGVSGSGAYSESIIPALQQYMSFSSSARLLYRRYYDIDVWVSYLKREIDANRPVLYGGYSSRGGHQFVLDGYDENDYFHINWGWGGSDNGYFRCPDFTEFTSNQDAIFDLIPNGSSSLGRDIYLTSANGVKGLQTDETEFAVGIPFTVKYALEYCLPEDETIKMGIGRFSREGKLLQIESDVFDYHFFKGTHTTIGEVILDLTGEAQIGETLRLCMYNADQSSWLHIPAKTANQVLDALPIADTYSVSEYTTISYDFMSSTIKLFSHAGVFYCLKDPQEQIILQGCVLEEVLPVEINLNGLKKGIYTISLSKGRDHKTIKLAL